MYDALVCTANHQTSTLGGPALPDISISKQPSIEFSSIKRKSQIDVLPKTTEILKRSSVNLNLERKRPPDPPPAPPVINIIRPLSVSSMASLSSTSSSSVSSSCGNGSHVARIRRPGIVRTSAYLASIESLDIGTDTEVDVVHRNASVVQQRRQRSKCITVSSNGSGDSGVCSPCSFIGSPSPVPTRPRYCDPQLSYTDRVVMEIVETEGVYVNDLQQVIVGYLERWKSSPDYPFSEDQLNDLFSNIQDIFHFNKSFLTELEQCGLDPVKIAKCFVRNNLGFSVYTDYCTNYPRTMFVLTELMRQDQIGKLFRERQLALQHTLPLGSYLLKPVQRILKYHLLLQNIVKNCQSDVEGYNDIVEALSTMTSIAKHINEMKRKHEHAVRVQEIQSLLLGWQGEDLTTFGELCAEGAFRVSGAKALRHVFLFDRMLLITKKKEEGILGYKAHIMCSNLMLIESVPGEPLSFHVIPFDNPKFQNTLQSRNLEQKREWCLQLKKVIIENYNAVIPSHARQLVMQLGQNRPEDEKLAEKSAPKRQHSAPEYLEKRKQEKNRRKSELCLLRSRLHPRTLRKSDVGTCQKSQEEIRRSLLLKSNGEMPGQRPSSQHEICDRNNENETPSENQGEPFVPSTESKENPTPIPESLDEVKEEEKSVSIEDEHATLEKIISQLLMQNGEFQKLFNKQRKLTRRRRTDTSEDEEECDYDNLSSAWGDSPRITKRFLSPTLSNDSWGSPRLIKRSAQVRRAHSFSSQDYENSSPDQSVDSSLSRFSLENSCNSTSLWVKHQPTPESNKKSDSLPRSFQIGGNYPAPDWNLSPRPVTIASDKAQELNIVDMQNYINRAEEICAVRHCFPTNLDDTTEEEMSTPDVSTNQLYIHPEYRIYKSGSSRTVLRHVINKLSNLRSNETLNDVGRDKKANVFSMFRPKMADSLPCYMQGSSRLGARIAHCNDNSDYADPRTLFPAITPNKKAAALLGIRPCHGSSLSMFTSLTEKSSTDSSDKVTVDNEKPKSEPFKPKLNPLKHINEDKLNALRRKLSLTRIDRKNPPPKNPESPKKAVSSEIEIKSDLEDSLSVGSADSFYERSLEVMESLTESDMFRDSAVFSDHEDDFSDEFESVCIPPPAQFEPHKSEDSSPLKELAESTKQLRSDIEVPSQFKGEVLEISDAENKKLNSKLDILKKLKDSSSRISLSTSLISNPLENMSTRSKKIIQISKISLNSVPTLEIKNSEKYIKDGGENLTYARRNLCRSSEDINQGTVVPPSVGPRRNSCKNFDTKMSISSGGDISQVTIKSIDYKKTNTKYNGVVCAHCHRACVIDVECNECFPRNSPSLDSVSKLSNSCEFEDSSSAASTVIEVSPSKQGWVKHMVNRLQSF